MVDPQNTCPSPFYAEPLPDDFFLSAPGLVGSITRELVYYSIQPYPNFCFAAACSAVGGLRGSYLRSDFSTVSPNMYFFCFAKTGRGKDFPRMSMIHALARAGQNESLTQKFRSAQGLHAKISGACGVQVVLHDEAHHFFGSLRNSTESYMMSLKPMLLELFSGWNNPCFDAGDVLSASHQLKSIPFPSVSYCGFGVPRGLEETFQTGDFEDGFLSRFIVFQSEKEVKSIESAKKVTKFDFESCSEWKQIIKQCDDFKRYRATYLGSGHALEFEYKPYSDDALKLYKAYSDDITFIRNNLEDGIPDVWVRAVELVGRMSLAMSDEGSAISRQCVEFAILLVNNYLADVVQMVIGQESSQDYKISQVVLETIKKSSFPLSLRDILMNSHKRKVEIETAISLLLDDGKIEKIEFLSKNIRARKSYRYRAI